ncbi:PucR family transcriptional regulator [Gordonia sp. TBRC 11910]|uniref:PucR family transcriptional regulator n=1 Tax=Gordonia asplenii TaxID=2725283 RepID=A0A848L8Y1_9ACTN|nr:helix-turn-helix domain-containing protein [Gordonia asplenii]NMO05223.1 PucR family transcriptional regulator [Gordonia asplenii]
MGFTPSSSVATVAQTLLSQVDDVADEMLRRIVDKIDVYADQTFVDEADHRRSLVENIVHILTRVSGESSDRLQVAEDLGRRRAEQGAPLPEILRAYRIGFTLLWERLLEAARAAGPQAVDALLDSATDIWILADDYSSTVTESYRAAMSEKLLAADRRRSGILSALLDGVPDDASAWEIAKLLELPYEGEFLVLVAETTELDVDPLPGLPGRLGALSIGSAWRSRPDSEIGVVSLPRNVDAGRVMSLVEGVASARVGFSPKFFRLDGTARALRLAQVALDSLPAGRRGARQLADEPQTDLLVRDLDTTRRFVRRVLGDLLRLPDDERTTLLNTAEVWVSVQGSAAAASRRLYCHENTVRHRLHRLEDYMEASLDDPRAVGDLTTALQAIRTFPQLGERVDG